MIAMCLLERAQRLNSSKATSTCQVRVVCTLLCLLFGCPDAVKFKEYL